MVGKSQVANGKSQIANRKLRTENREWMSDRLRAIRDLQLAIRGAGHAAIGHAIDQASSAAMHFNSIAIGVGSAVMPSVVRHGCALVKYSA